MTAQLESVFRLVLAASWQGSIVVVLILLLRPLMGARIPAAWRSWLWLLVIARLLIPVPLLPPSPVAMQNVAVVDHPLEQVGLVESQPSFDFAPLSQGAPESTPSPSATATSSVSWKELAAWVWLAGTVVGLVTIVAAQIIIRRRLGPLNEPTDPAVLQAWGKSCERLGVKRRPLLRTSAGVASPALLGLLRPMLLLPENFPGFAEADWENIFVHELAHHRRGDSWTQALQLLALAIHWFNPVAWVGFRQMRADRELAADEWALQHLGAEGSTSYGDTLLKVLEQSAKPALPMATVGILEDRVQLQQRLRRIVGFSRVSIFGSVAGFAIVVAVALLVLGRPAEKADLTYYPNYTPNELLIKAAQQGDLQVVRKMLRDGADINAVGGYYKQTPLSIAAVADQQDVVRFLISKGANLDRKAPDGLTPLEDAMANGRGACADILLKAGAKCSQMEMAAYTGDMPLLQVELQHKPLNFNMAYTSDRIAACNGKPEAFRAILHAIRALPGKSQWRIEDREVVTMIARGQRESLLAFLDEKPSWDVGGHGGVVRIGRAAAQTPGMRDWMIQQGFTVPEYTDGERLIDAAEYEDLAEMDRLLKKGVPVEYLGESSWTPITKAATWNRVHSVKFLLEHGANPNSHHYSYTGIELTSNPAVADLLFKAGAKFEPSAVDYNLTFGSPAIVQWFLDHGVEATKILPRGRTYLFSVGSPEIAELLIAHGADPKKADDNGRTALHEVCMYGQKSAAVARVLLEHGANPNAFDKRGYSPLVGARDGATVDVLADYGADVNIKLKDGSGLLSLMDPMAEPSRFEALMRHGLSFDPKADGPSILLKAAWAGQNEVVAVLLEKGVDPNAEGSWPAQSGSKMLPIDMAIVSSSLDVIKMLLDHGAKITDRAIDTALVNQRVDVIKLFHDRGAPNLPEVTYQVTQGISAPELQKMLDSGANPAIQPKGTRGSIAVAAQFGNLDALKILADHTNSPADSIAALNVATTWGQDEIVSYLLQRGTIPGPNILMGLALNCHPYDDRPNPAHLEKTLALLIAAGVLKSSTEQDKAELVRMAIFTNNPGGNPAVAKQLIDAGASIDVPNKEGETVREMVLRAAKPENHMAPPTEQMLALINSIPENKPSPGSTAK